MVETLIAVVETGSFSLAAKQLGISQSTVSRRIAALEKKLKGKPIIKRGSRWLELTERAQQYVVQIKNILAQLDSAEAILNSHDDKLEGLLRISMLPGLGGKYLVPALAELHTEYPKLILKMQFVDETVDIKGDPYDIAVRLTPSQQAGMECLKLHTCKLQMCASSQYCEKHGIPANVKELKNHTLIAHAAQADQKTIKISGKRLQLAKGVKPSIFTDDFRTIYQMVGLHAGISLLPDYLIKEDLASGRMKTFDMGIRIDPLTIYACYRRDLKDSAKVRVTLKYFKKALQL
ncbi:LysR family transcriptional regulator [Marinicella sp. W31]|uniref:LysR family transcriptional regulator n=1 Tax=Marinicella sp. W31 TaxID=3023713 RepID=UPI0037576C21